jgi:hypothetical protein
LLELLDNKEMRKKIRTARRNHSGDKDRSFTAVVEDTGDVLDAGEFSCAL